MVEATVRPFHTERSEKLIRLAGVTEVATDVGVELDDVIAGFSAGDQVKHRGSVFLALSG